MVIDNAGNYVAIRILISHKYKHTNLTSCATHYHNLVFKDICKLDHITKFARHASNVTIFVYKHVALLSWLRKK